MDTAYGLVIKIFIIFRDGNLGRDTIGGQPSLDLLLRRDIDCDITFNDRLAGEGEALFYIRSRKPECTASSGAALDHLHRAATTTALSAAGLIDFNASQMRRIRHDDPCGDTNAGI